jgi:subtilisin family serine protease
VAGEISGQYGMGTVPILPLRIVKGIDANGHTMLDMVAASDAIRYAVDHGARVLNMSFGGNGITPQYFIEALHYAADHGALAVFSAGNSVQSNDLIEFSSANTSRDEWNAISVAATDKNDLLASFSNWGVASVQAAAPGDEIFGEQSTATSYTFGSGTSAAAPIVSALLAKAFDLYTISGSDLIAQAKAAKDVVLSTGDARTPLIGKVGSASRVNVTRLIGGSRNPLPELVLPSSFQVAKKQKVTLSGDFSTPQGVYASFVWQIDDNEATITAAPTLLYKAKGVGSHTLSCTMKLYSGSSFVVTSTIQVPILRRGSEGE